jgi:predicted outer membrane protein
MSEHESRVGMIAAALKVLTVLTVVCWGARAAALPPRADAGRPDALRLISEGEPKAAPPSKNTVTAADRQVLQKLHDANQMEIQMGHLAQDKGSARAVKDFGSRLIADHTQAEKKIGDYLRRHALDVTAFASTTSEDSDHDALATRSGVAFDRVFMVQAATDHQKAIDLLERARNDTADDELKALYEQLLTTARAHKKAAQELSSSKARA